MTPRAGGERGGGTATATAWAGPCSHHLGDEEGTGDSNRTTDTRTPSGRPQLRAAPNIASGPSIGVRAHGTPNSAGAQTSWGVAAHTPGSWKLQIGSSWTPPPPGVVERGQEDAAAGGSDCRRGSPDLCRDQQRLKFLLSRSLLSGSMLVGFPHCPRGSQFPPSPTGPRILKGAVRSSPCLTLCSPLIGPASSAC